MTETEDKKQRQLRIKQYRQGAEGFFAWAEDNVCLDIYPIKNGNISTVKRWVLIKDLTDEKHPVTGRSYKEMWERQKDILREALKMENGAFVYTLLVFCWMRGEGKSLLVCIVLLWRFFCWPRLQIMLGANSKEQTKFVHYDIMRDIIRNSPKLRKIVGEKNIQEKEIRLTNRKGEVTSLIRSISTASGIVSNISNYSFSEIFDMKNPKFFVQLDGSIRNIPNAFGMIDSTVSTRDHILFRQYEGWKKGELPNVFFSHRQSKEAREEDYWNPYMTQAQLDGYRRKFPEEEFERYFKNSWDSGSVKPFTREILDETGIIACEGKYLDHGSISQNIAEKYRLLNLAESETGVGFKEDSLDYLNEVTRIEAKLMPVDSVYTLQGSFGPLDFAPVDTINRLGELLKTDFVISAGLDMSDPMAIYKKARTILTFVAKGLPGSKYDMSWINEDRALLKYIYFLIGVVFIEDASIDSVKVVLDKAHAEYDSLDSFCGERWGSGNLNKFLDEKKIKYEFVSPGYDRQRDCFKELFLATREGRFKKPRIHVPGVEGADIIVEEMGVFYHDTTKRWFGSPYKDEKYGVQDDSIFSLGWCIYGGRELAPEHFRERKPSLGKFGLFVPDPTRKRILRSI